MKKENTLYKINNSISSVLIWAVPASIMIQVIFRYLIGKPLTWPEELARYMMIWLVFTGATNLAKEKKHIRIDFFVNALPLRAQTVISVLNNMIVSLSLIALLIGSWTPLGNFLYLKSPAMRIPFILVYVIVPISSLSMLWVHITEIVSDFKSLGNSFRKGEVQ